MDDIATPGDTVLPGTDDIAITRDTTADGVVLCVAGELDLLTAPAFSDRLQTEITAAAGAVVLDLGQVTFMSSFGIDALLKAQELAGPRLHIRAIHPSVRRVLELSSLLERFNIPSADGDSGR
jgi:anti-anti-sigma factor